MSLSARLLIAGLLTVGMELAAWRFIMRPYLAWHDIKFGKEAVRQTILHSVLLTGSVIFLVPFAWLVVTSLKEDSEMSKFPPVWIPTQQVKRVVDGHERGLATTTYKGQKVEVAVMKEFDTGERSVQVLKPAAVAGQSFVCDKTTLTDIRHVAPVWKNYPNALTFLSPETQYGFVFLKNTLVVSILSIWERCCRRLWWPTVFRVCAGRDATRCLWCFWRR